MGRCEFARKRSVQVLTAVLFGQSESLSMTTPSSQSRIIEKSCMGKLFVDAQQPDAKAGRQQANSRKGEGPCSKQHHIFVLLFSYSSQGGSNRVLRMSEKRKNTFIHCKKKKKKKKKKS